MMLLEIFYFICIEKYELCKGYETFSFAFSFFAFKKIIGHPSDYSEKISKIENDLLTNEVYNNNTRQYIDEFRIVQI